MHEIAVQGKKPFGLSIPLNGLVSETVHSEAHHFALLQKHFHEFAVLDIEIVELRLPLFHFQAAESLSGSIGPDRINNIVLIDIQCLDNDFRIRILVQRNLYSGLTGAGNRESSRQNGDAQKSWCFHIYLSLENSAKMASAVCCICSGVRLTCLPKAISDSFCNGTRCMWV